jgi:hypothetical protein
MIIHGRADKVQKVSKIHTWGKKKEEEGEE